MIPEHNLIFVKGKGTVLFEDLVGHVSEFMEHDTFSPGMNILYDMTDLQRIDGNLQVLLDTAEALTDEAYIPVPAKTAFLIDDSGNLCRILQGFCIMTSYSRVPHFIVNDVSEIEPLFNLRNDFDPGLLKINEQQ